MNWTTNKSAVSAVSKMKRKQIEKLKQHKYIITELQRDVQYKLDFQLKKDKNHYCMIIDLPPTFPSDAPVIFIHPVCSHKFVDAAQQVTKFPPLLNFKKKPDLVHVVNKLVSEFEKNPPISLLHGYLVENAMEDFQHTLKETVENDNDAESLLPGCSASDMLTHTLSRENSIITKSVQYKSPDIPDNFTELDDLTSEELTEILTDESKIIDLFHNIDQVKSLVDDREKLSQNIQKLANENLSRSSEIDQWRERLVQSYEKCRKLQEVNEKKEKKFNDEIQWFSPSNMAVLLKVATAEAEQSSEKIAEEFLQGDLDVSKFVKQYLEAKTLNHTRRALEDKMQLIAKVT